VFLPGLEEDSDSDSNSSSITTSVSYSYTVNSINSRKSRTMVLYQRPVRPLRVEAIPESTITDSKALSPLSGRPASLPTSPHADLTPLVDKQVSRWRAMS
jgi:hypothetical protein